MELKIKRRNIHAYGMEFLKEFIDKYYINCTPKEKDKLNEEWIDGDIDKFNRLINSIPNEYIFKDNYKRLHNAYNSILKEKMNGFKDFYEETEEECRKEMEHLLNVYKLDLKNQYVIKIRDLEKELEKQKAINEKWKAMFTEQAMANAKLINKE